MVKIGDLVQWISQGIAQFNCRKVSAVSDDGQYVFVEGSATGLPIEQIKVLDLPRWVVRMYCSDPTQPIDFWNADLVELEKTCSAVDTGEAGFYDACTHPNLFACEYFHEQSDANAFAEAAKTRWPAFSEVSVEDRLKLRITGEPPIAPVHNEQSLRDSGIFKTCPKCHQRAVAIVYGHPTEQGLQLERNGLMAYGGCCSCASDPGWVCLTCQHRFGERIDHRDQFGHREKLDVYWEQIKVIESSRKEMCGPVPV